MNGRSDRIRTYDPLVPNEVRYQTALHSDTCGGSAHRAGLIDAPAGWGKRKLGPRLRFRKRSAARAEKPRSTQSARCARADLFVSHGKTRSGSCGWASPALWSARLQGLSGASRALGRRQAVRQWILIPPCGGSNPPAPATHSRHFAQPRVSAERPAFAGDSRAVCRLGDTRRPKLGAVAG